MHIIHIASELAPLAKVGGLADVLLGLCRELSWKGHDVDIIIPKYDCMDSSQIRDLSVAYDDLMSYYDGKWFSNTIWTGWVENLRVYFIEPHHPRHFFNRGCFYGCDDDIERYLYFSRVAVEFLFKKPICPSIIHLHDWQTGIIPLLSTEIYAKEGFCQTKTVFTIHNLEYQGKCSPKDIERIGITTHQDKYKDSESPELANLLRCGITTSDFVTTVSPTYAKEALTPEQGRGLQEDLLARKETFKGILNGVDYSYWNPEIDRFLPVNYSAREVPANKKDRNTLDKKAFLKKIFRDKMMLSEDYRPIVGSVTRLVPQKGMNLIKNAIPFIVENGGQFVLLGSTSDPEVAAEFQALKQHYADHPHVHLTLHHNEETAHMIFAASDMFVVPSIFEPCGLTQMIALKYGSIPIVRKTGGLGDTIFDVDSGKPLGKEANGYVFEEPTDQEFQATIRRAFECWFHQQDRWRQMLISGMNIDYSWNESSNEYLEIYQKVNPNHHKNNNH